MHWASEASTEREGLAALTRQNSVVVRYDTLEKLLDHTGVPKLRVWVCRYGMKASATRGQNSARSFADARAAFSKLRESAGSLQSRILADSGPFDKY